MKMEEFILDFNMTSVFRFANKQVIY